MTVEDIEIPLRAPVSELSEDELLLQETVRKFARKEMVPLVREMDESQKMDPKLIKQLFAQGLMGIEVPAEYGGGGADFFSSILAIEEISAVDPSVGTMVDVQNTLTVNALKLFGSEAQKQKYFPRMATDHDLLLRPQRSGLWLGCVCAAHQRARRGGRVCHQRQQAVDYECRGIRALYRVCNGRRVARLQGHHGVSGGARHARLHGGQERRQAGHSRVFYLRTAVQ